MMYSLNQITWGSMIGGPLAGAWMISRNYALLDMPEMHLRARIIGFSSAAIAWILVLYIPEDIPGIPIALSLVLIVRVAADALQKKHIENRLAGNGRYMSNWKVVGAGFLCLAITFIVMFAYFFAMVFVAPGLLPESLLEDG